MINLIIFIIAFIAWLYSTIKNPYVKWYTAALCFIWGFFGGQTIVWLCGIPTLIEIIF